MMRSDGIWHRDCRGDRLAVRDTAAMFRKGAARPGDVCLDLGAHIGAFTFRALAAGAASVIAVEPMPDNLELFRRNIGSDPRVLLLAGAVTANLIGREQLWTASEKATDSHTMLATRGRTAIDVDTFSLTELCEEHFPTFVKIDVEGSEYDIDIPESVTPSVQRLFVEYHFKRKGHREAALAIREELFTRGFSVAWGTNWTPAAWWEEEMYVR